MIRIGDIGGKVSWAKDCAEGGMKGPSLSPLDHELVSGDGEQVVGGDEGLQLAPLDLELVGRDGERVAVSKLILAAFSPVLCSLLRSQGFCSGCSETSLVFLPWATSNIIREFVQAVTKTFHHLGESKREERKGKNEEKGEEEEEDKDEMFMLMKELQLSKEFQDTIWFAILENRERLKESTIPLKSAELKTKPYSEVPQLPSFSSDTMNPGPGKKQRKKWERRFATDRRNKMPRLAKDLTKLQSKEPPNKTSSVVANVKGFHKSREPKFHTCSLCAFSTEFMDRLKYHYSTKHFKEEILAGSEDTSVCGLCGFKSHNKCYMTMHYATKHEYLKNILLRMNIEIKDKSKTKFKDGIEVSKYAGLDQSGNPANKTHSNHIYEKRGQPEGLKVNQRKIPGEENTDSVMDGDRVDEKKHENGDTCSSGLTNLKEIVQFTLPQSSDALDIKKEPTSSEPRDMTQAFFANTADSDPGVKKQRKKHRKYEKRFVAGRRDKIPRTVKNPPQSKSNAEPAGNLSCALCEHITSTPSSLKYHYSTKHFREEILASIDDTTICGLCGYKSKIECMMIYHCATKHGFLNKILARMNIEIRDKSNIKIKDGRKISEHEIYSKDSSEIFCESEELSESHGNIHHGVTVVYVEEALVELENDQNLGVDPLNIEEENPTENIEQENSHDRTENIKEEKPFENLARAELFENIKQETPDFDLSMEIDTVDNLEIIYLELIKEEDKNDGEFDSA